MANPQLENGYLKIANELYRAIARTRIPGEERQVFDAILLKTYGFNKKRDAISLSQFVEITELKKPNIIRARESLLSKAIITVIKNDNGNPHVYEINKDFDQWKPLSKTITLSKAITNVIKSDNKSLSKAIPTKDNIKTLLKDKRESFSSKDEIAACPHQEIINLYHEILPECRNIRKWTETRMKKLRARWREDEKHRSLDFWKSYFENVRLCFWFTDRNGRQWYPDLEWLCEQRNFIAVLEKKYL